MSARLIVDHSLPAGFEELQPFVATWAHAAVGERVAARCNASMEEIRLFYDVMNLRLESILALLRDVPIDAMGPAEARLFQLVLALTQAAVAIEIHGSPRRPGTPWPNSIRISQGPTPFG